jgi:hypothetical protein
MTGTVQSYSIDTLTVNVTSSNGSGYFSNWSIGIVGNTGAQGSSGTNGVQGVQGLSGTNGTGTQGTQGIQGATAYTGTVDSGSIISGGYTTIVWDSAVNSTTKLRAFCISIVLTDTNGVLKGYSGGMMFGNYNNGSPIASYSTFVDSPGTGITISAVISNNALCTRIENSSGATVLFKLSITSP